MDVEAWLAAERSLIDRDRWTPPPQRKLAEDRKKREASYNTVRTFAERYLGERGLRPTTVHSYKGLLCKEARTPAVTDHVEGGVLIDRQSQSVALKISAV